MFDQLSLQSTQSMKINVFLRKRSHSRLSPRLCTKVKKCVTAAKHNGWLVDPSQWFPKYGSKPKQQWRRDHPPYSGSKNSQDHISSVFSLKIHRQNIKNAFG